MNQINRSNKKEKAVKPNSKSLARSPHNANSLLTPKTTKIGFPTQFFPSTRGHKPSCDFSTLSMHTNANDLLSRAGQTGPFKNLPPGYPCSSKSPLKVKPNLKKSFHVPETEASDKKPVVKLNYHASSKRRSGQFAPSQTQPAPVNPPRNTFPNQVTLQKANMPIPAQDKTPPRKKIPTEADTTDEQEFVCIYSTLDIHDLLDQSKQDEPVTQRTEKPSETSQSKQITRGSHQGQHQTHNHHQIHLESSLESTTQTSSEGMATQESERSHMKRSIVEGSDYSKKKTKCIQIDLGANQQENRLSLPKVSDFKTDNISEYLPTQEFNSRMMTEESEQSRTVEETSRKFQDFRGGRLQSREEELNNFRHSITETMEKLPQMDELCQKNRGKLQRNLTLINERIQLFTAKMASILQAQTESMIADINLEFGKELIKHAGFSDRLKNVSKWLQETNMDIRDNYSKILHNIGEDPYKMIMDKYKDKLCNFEEFFSELKANSTEPAHLLPTEKISHFKRKLKITMNDAFTDCLVERGLSQTEVCHNNPVSVASPPLPKMKTIGDFEDFLRSEEKGEDSLKARPLGQNNVIVSFENKDMFENALQASTAMKGLPQGFNIDAFFCNAILTESEEMENPLMINNLDTPKLNAKFEGVLARTQSNMSEFQQESYLSGPEDSAESSLNKYMSLLDKVNQKQLNRNNYLKSGGSNFINFLENKLKVEGVRETCQKSLFQSPAFKENEHDLQLEFRMS